MRIYILIGVTANICVIDVTGVIDSTVAIGTVLWLLWCYSYFRCLAY